MAPPYTGSCHCGAVAFSAPLDLSEGVRKCNCSFCFKMGYKKAFAYGDSVVVTRGADKLGHYVAEPSNWPPGHIDHVFCKHCGTQVFSRGYLEFAPFNGFFHAVNVATLDGLSPAELDGLPVIYEDGLADRQTETPAHTSYL